MERIDFDPRRLTSLAHALSDAFVAAEPAADVALIDPAAELEIERARVLDAASEEGRARGMRGAEQVIAERVAAVETKLTEAHEARVKALEHEQERLTALVHAIPSALREMDQQIAETAVEVAYRAIARVVGQQWADKDLLAELCRASMRDNRLTPGIVRVAPEDALRFPHPLADLQVVPDADLKVGQCIIESSKGRLSTGLDVRLTAIRDALLDGLQRGAA
jgi:flagellar biosynthesis/type III secretory pathway protein FliH